MPNVAEYLHASYSGLSLDEALQQPIAALLGVSDQAAEALRRIGVVTLFDLGSSWLFANAAAVIDASLRRHGTPGSDLLRADVLDEQDDVASLPVESLRGISDEDAQAIKQALQLATIREFALWPPRRIAQRLVSEATGATLDVEEEHAEALRPRLGEYPTERVYYNTLVMLGMGESADRRPLNGAISLQPVVDDPGFGQPAVGALITFSQSWYAKGITLGHMLHSLALAPGEATRIAVMDWSRRTRATVAETIEEAERLDSATAHSRAVSEVQNAVAEEMQSGGSMSSGWARSESKGNAGGFSVGGGIAGAYQGITGVLGFGGGTSSSSQEAETWTSASSSSWSIGNRSVMAEMAQRVNDRTEQHSTSVRNRRASAVREVAQSEHEEVSTRIVANYNHMHALTVQYYEVVQIYSVVAQVHSVQRVLFLPFQLLDFSGAGAADVVARFRAQLVAAALSERIRTLLLDDRGVIEIRSAVRVSLPIFTGEFLAGIETVATARLARSDVGTAGNAGSNPPPQPPTVEPGGGILTAPPPPLQERPRFARPGPVVDALPGDAQLVSVSFEGVGVDRVRIDRPGVPASDSTYVVPSATNQVDFARAIPLRGVETIHAGKTAPEPDTGTMTLRYESAGVRRTLSIALDLGAGTIMQKVAFFTADPANRKEELLSHLQSNRAYYTRAVLGRLDSASLVMLLSAYTWRGKPLADQVEPNPLAVAGNFLVLRAPVENDEPAGIGENGLTWGALVQERALTPEQQDARLVPIPTGGVFAEAVLGRSNSAEKLDITRFWNWQDSPIPLQPPEIAPIATGSRATAEDLRPGQLGAPVLNILNPTALPEPAGLTAALNTLASGSMFRDMSGLAGTQSMAQAAAAGTLTAATEAGRLASTNLKTVTDQAVAMGQAAADMWKTLHSPGSGGGSNGGTGSRNSISADGARINHGRDMDERGVSGSGNGSSMSTAGEPSGESEMPGSDYMPGVSDDFMREAAYSDISAANVSPAMLGSTAQALGAPVQPASFTPAIAAQSSAAGFWARAIRRVLVKQLLDQIRKDLAKLGFNLGGVSLLDMQDHKQYAKLKMFNAWTNSATDVYVNYEGVDELAAYLKKQIPSLTNSQKQAELVYGTVLVRHELHHVEQFKTQGGRPSSYKKMCQFEKSSYAEDSKWLSDNRQKLKSMGMSNDVIDHFIQITSDISQTFDPLTQLNSEKEIKAGMIKADMLPPHNNLDELYKDK